MRNCDVVAVKEDQIVIVELKLHLNLEVILQALERQKITPFVYIAIPKLKKEEISSRHLKIHHLLQKLQIGLLYVNAKNKAELMFDQFISNSSSFDLIELSNVIREFVARESINNVGGVHQSEIMTAYKEEAIRIAKWIRVYTRLTLAQLSQYGTGPGTYSILCDNHYGWFIKESHGYYRLSQTGKDYLAELDAQREVVIYD